MTDHAAIVKRWLNRRAERLKLLRAARKRHEWNPTPESRAVIDKRKEQVAYADRVIARHRDSVPQYHVVQRGTAVWRTGGYGSLGPIHDVTVHHDAGTRPTTFEAVRARIVNYDAMHTNLYGGGIGYHEIIDQDGRVWPVRSPQAKGAHTGRRNTSNYGICVLGNFETQEPTAEQLRTLRARLTQPPKDGLPDLRGHRVRGHQDWPGQNTACPGKNLKPHVRALPHYAG